MGLKDIQKAMLHIHKMGWRAAQLHT